MKRKLFNVALFGAVLVAAPVSTFVSCADYDSDIKNLQTEVKDLNDAVKEINAQITDLKAADAALALKDAELEQMIKDCSAECALKLAECKAECAAARAELQALIDALQTQVNNIEDGLVNTQEDVKNLTEGLVTLRGTVKDIQTKVGELEEGLLNTQTDVQNLTEGLTQLRGTVKTLEADVAALKTQVEANKTQIDANKTKIAANEAALKALQEWKATHEKEFKDAKAELQGAIDELKKKDEALATDVETLFDGLSVTQKDVMDLQAWLHDVEADVTSNTKSILALAFRVVDIESALYDLRKNIEEVSAEVKSLVLEPACYTKGVQTIEGEYFYFTTYDVSNPLVPQVQTSRSYCPEVHAVYHVNPSVAKLSENADNYKYVVLDRHTRAQHELGVNVEGVSQKENGMLDVWLSVDDVTKNKYYGSEITVMALQYTNPAAKAENQVVTSDYAALHLNVVENANLLLQKEGVWNFYRNYSHAYAVNVPYLVKDAENNTSVAGSYDVAGLVGAYFGGDLREELPYGFHYNYTIVGGDKEDDQYYFGAGYGAAQGVFSVQDPDKDLPTFDCVGKYALVRVDLMCGAQVVDYAYVKLNIIGENIVNTAEAVTYDKGRLEWHGTCDDDEVAFEHTFDIAAFRTYIQTATGETATDAAKYTFDGKIYEKNAEGVYVEASAAKYGTVTVNNDKAAWKILYKNTILQDLYGTAKSITVYVKASREVANEQHTLTTCYVPLTWTPETVEVWATDGETVNWAYGKVANQWHANADTKQDEILVYANPVEVDNPFTFDIATKAMRAGTDKSLVVVNADNFTKTATFTDVKFIFIKHEDPEADKVKVSEDVTYVLSVTPDGKKLQAKLLEGTVLNDVATITDDGVVTLVKNDVTKALVNANEKTALKYGETLCARVALTAKTCMGKININNDFDVRFVKPIYVKDEVLKMVDASATVSYVNVLDNVFAFNDAVIDPAKWDATVEFAEKSKWMTDYDNSEFEKPITAHAIADNFTTETTGKVTFDNNGAKISSFTVKVPVTVKYSWGEVKATVSIQVGKTAGLSKRR